MKTTKPLPSKTFCVLPFMHIATNPGGSYRLCCNSNPNNNQIKDENGKPFKIFKHSVEEVWNSESYKNFRRQFINGEMPSTCERCYREEDSGIRSP